jgi:hypothetical protein
MLSQEKRDFLLEHPELVVQPASWHFPFTQEQLRKYYDLFCWEYIGDNEAIKWNTDIIDEFIDDLLPIITEDNDPGYGVYGINTNYSLPWSVELIERYMDRWNWDHIAYNQILPKELRLHFAEHIMATTDYDIYERENRHDEHADLRDLPEMVGWQIERMREHHELCIQDPDDIIVGLVDWEPLSANEFLPWSEELIAKYEFKWDWGRLSRNDELPWSVKLIDRFIDRWVWGALSANTALPWTEEFVERYANRWIWPIMSENQALPWSHNFIRKYENLLSWEKCIEDENGWTSDPIGSLCNNYNIPWTIEMWEEYHHKLEGHTLGMIKNMNWDFETVKRYCHYWKADRLCPFQHVLDSAFPELQEPETVISLMDEILERYRRGDYNGEE